MVAEVTSRAEGSLEIPRGLARAEGALDIDLPSLLIVALMEETSEEHVVAPVVGVDAAVLVAEEQIIVTELSKFPSMSSPQIPIARPNANSDRCSSILWRSGRHGCRHGRGWGSTRRLSNARGIWKNKVCLNGGLRTSVVGAVSSLNLQLIKDLHRHLYASQCTKYI
ncbi:hypothetical protein JHK87_039965 [Glycine soja]|nr:hypothetical protein JHK87_039965 [Glycine soja]